MEQQIFPSQNKSNKEIDICEEIKKSIESIILYRSLYILKKKIDLNKPKIRTLYNTFNIDKNSNVIQYNSYQVNIENFVIISETIFKECNILLTTLSNPKDIFLSNLFLNINQKISEMNAILNEIKNYITDENNSLIKKYNNLFYEKKIKPFIVKNILEKKKNKIVHNTDKIHKEENIEQNNNLNDKELSGINEYGNKENEDNNINKVEDEEIQKDIVEYNRKGKIIRTYSRMVNDNLTLSINKEKEKNEKRKNNRMMNNKFFQISENNDDFVGNYMQNIINKSKNIDNYNDVIDEKEEYNYELDSKNKTVSIYSNLIDIENGKNPNNILYIETLPLIIADYIQQFPFYCIIEIESELSNELNILFDKELIEKMNTYEEALKIKNQNFISKELTKCESMKIKLENSIKIYENLIMEKKSKGENYVFLENMLEKLLAKNIVVQERITQLKTESNNITKSEINSKNELNLTNNLEINNISKYSNIVPKITEPNNNNKSVYNNEYDNNNNSIIKINENGKEKLSISQFSTNFKLRKIASTKTNRTNKTIDSKAKTLLCIKEIFNFYSRQHSLIGAKGLFEDIEKNKEHLTSSDFCKFCQEYNIPITRQKSLDIYKKSLSITPKTYNKPNMMNLDEFMYSLKLIANYINQSKLDLMQKNIQQEREKLNSIETRQIKFKEVEKYNNSINLNSNNSNNINSNGNKYTFDKGDFFFECEKKKLVNSIFNLENKYNGEKNKTENEIMNNFISYIGINSNNDYKSKLKGFLLPFKTHEKQKSITKGKHGIGSPLENEIREASKVYIMQKNEKKKLVLSKEVVDKQMLFKQKKKMFRLKNDKLCNNVDKKINRKYSDRLSNFKNELKRKKEKNLEMKKKEEYERKNFISWNRLEDFDVNNLDIDESEKKIFIDIDNSDDDENVNKASNEKKKKSKKRLNKNNSAVELIPKKKILLPPIKQNINNILDNIENNSRESEYINVNNEYKEKINNDNNYNNMKRVESNNFSNLSAISDNNQNYSNFE